MRYAVSNAKSRFVSSVSQIKVPYQPSKSPTVQEKSVSRSVITCIVIFFIVGQMLLFYYLYNHHSLFKHSSTSALDEIIISNSVSSLPVNEVIDNPTDSIISSDTNVLPEEEYRFFPVSITSTHSLSHIKHRSSQELIMKLLGNKSVTEVDFPDLSYRSKQEIETKFPKIFSEELPKLGFHNDYRNPCWFRALPAESIPGEPEDTREKEQRELVCLPYAYVLGQPKCGTSDLFERLKKHPDIM
jgi:hypothetical protein